MQLTIIGAGAVGGVVAAGLVAGGHDVTVLARGAHGQALRERGLTVLTPTGTRTVAVRTCLAPRELADVEHDAVLLCTKSQDTEAALASIAPHIAPTIPIVCLQNGVDNERMALRFFPQVYAVAVILPALHVEPGTVVAYASPTIGVFEVGRYPEQPDPFAATLVEAFRSAGLDAEARDRVMRWKYAKLLTNLVNAVDALVGPGAHGSALVTAARAEGVACLAAAGIDVASPEEDAARRTSMQVLAVEGAGRPGGSSWQSLARGVGTIEAPYLNGEIVLLGRQLGVPTPVNAGILGAVLDAAIRRTAPGTVALADLEASVFDS